MKTITTANLSPVEHLFVKTGAITAVRQWHSGRICEIDLHLPEVAFEAWKETQSIKCRIYALHYTSYTPSMWDVNDKICTLYIDTSHNGAGSNWAKSQLAGNSFYYLKTAAEKHYPVEGKKLFFLGDQTGLGHFCALQQLAAAGTEIKGFITFNDAKAAGEFLAYCPWLPLKAISDHTAIIQETKDWLTKNQSEKEDFAFYITGNATLIVKLRKLVKSYGIPGNLIKSKGFW